jgi:hypothetical protein
LCDLYNLAYVANTRSNNTWLVSLYKQVQTTLGLSPFTNKIKQHLAYLPLQTRSNNTWLISLYKQVQTTLGSEISQVLFDLVSKGR